jgi:sugar lactone lactonase YvrE
VNSAVKGEMMKHIIILLLLIFVVFSACSSLETQEPIIRTVETINLNGENYFPDGIAIANDGTLFVGSMWTGQIDRIMPDSTIPSSFIPAEPEGRTVLGLQVDNNAEVLWAVFWDFQGFMSIPAKLKSFDLSTGSLVQEIEFPQGSIGNDLTLDNDGNLYITCSFTHRIYRLESGSSELEIWLESPIFSEDWVQGNWTLNGIDFNGKNALFISRTDQDALYKVFIDKYGKAGQIQEIQIEDSLSNMGYDGLEALGENTLLLTEYATNRLSLITVEGDSGIKQVVQTELDFPSNVTVQGDVAWVVESQINHLLYPDGAGPAEAPFSIEPVSISEM